MFKKKNQFLLKINSKLVKIKCVAALWVYDIATPPGSLKVFLI